MDVYLTLILLMSSLSVVTCFINNKTIKDVIYWGSCIVLIGLFASMDISVGADTLIYYEAFGRIARLDFTDILNANWEWGYVFINWLLSLLGDDGRILIGFLSVAILLPIFRWIKKESLLPELSLVIFIGTGMWWASLGIFRQWCAIAVLTYSYRFIKEKSFVRFVLTVLIATCFHRTAAIFLLAYFISKLPINKLMISVLLPVSACIGIAGDKILGLLNNFARIAESANYNGGISMLIVLWLCLLSIFLCYRGNIPMNLKLYYQMIYFAALIQPISFTFSNWSRVVTYFAISLVILIPNFIISYTSRVNNRLRLYICIFACSVMVVWLILQSLKPYQSVIF